MLRWAFIVTSSCMETYSHSKIYHQKQMFSLYWWTVVGKAGLYMALSVTERMNLTLFYPALVLYEWSNFIDWINFCYIRSLIKYIVLLVPDSCWAIVRYSNNTRPDYTDETIKKNQLNRCLFLLFLNKLAVVLGFLTLQDKHIIRTLSVNITFIYIRYKTEQKSSPKAHFFYLFLKLV